MGKKSVAVVETNEIMERPDFMAGHGRGSEEVKASDLAIPRLSIIQSLSPQRKKNDPAYIEGAEEGMIFNTVSRELYEGGVTMVPCYFRPEWVLWKLQDFGGGFLGSYPSEEEGEKAWAQQENKNQCELVDTGNHFCLLLHPDGRAEEVVVSMSVSQQKISRQWNSMIRIAGGDRFERKYKLEAVAVQNKKGQDFFNWKVTQLGFVDKTTYDHAESLYEAMAAGKKTVAHGDEPVTDADM
jgi:hypothetical protein